MEATDLFYVFFWIFLSGVATANQLSQTTNFSNSVHCWMVHLTEAKLFCDIQQLKCTFWVSREVTWLIAVSCGQGRHDSCPLFPGVPQAVEIVRRCQSADLLFSTHWSTSSIYWWVLCHWTLQENQVLEVMKTRLHTSLSFFVLRDHCLLNTLQK